MAGFGRVDPPQVVLSPGVPIVARVTRYECPTRVLVVVSQGGLYLADFTTPAAMAAAGIPLADVELVPA